MKTIEFELPVLDLDNVTPAKQAKKVIEEFKEWGRVDNDNIAHDFEESFDLIQSMSGHIGKLGTLEEIQTAAELHCKKLVDRGWKTKGRIVVRVEVEG